MATIPKAPTTDFTGTTLNGSINDSQLTITVNDASTIQTPTFLVIDREDNNGTATPNAREVVYASGKAGNDITVVRAQDNSTARSHNDSAKVEPLMTVGFYSDLYDVITAEHSTTGTHGAVTATSVNIGSTIAITGTLDEDNMASNSAVKLATQQSIKAYVDAAVSGVSATKLVDSSAVDTVLTSATASAINEVTVKNAAINNAPQILATGDDTNIHLDLRGKGNGLVKIEVLRQDDTTNSYKPQTVILTGWGWKLGSTGVDEMTEAVSFGITFSEVPIIIPQFVGIKDAADPTVNSDFAAGDWQTRVQGIAPATTGFTVHFIRVSKDGADPGDFTGTTRYGYNWIAVGTF